jgi:7-carboxy-7-deazaguanine synthase
MALIVSEIFKSIQGESTWAGKPCVFVRLAGCDLRCAWCDTQYAWEPVGGRERRKSGDHAGAECDSYAGTPVEAEFEERSVEDVTLNALALGGDLVEITGGEPLLQDDCPALANGLLKAGRVVLVETNGSRPIDVLPEGAICIMDIKCPSSGVANRMDWDNIDRLRPDDEVKFVVAADYEYARDTIQRRRLPKRCRAVLLSPVFGRLDPADLAEWLLEDGLDVRLNMQIHKIVWDPERRGV